MIPRHTFSARIASAVLLLPQLTLREAHPVPTDPSPSILLIVIDDLGVDRIGAYEAHPNPGRTPNIDGLAERGVLFRNAYANPICSPTRATILTGRYSFRTGVGETLGPGGNGRPLSLTELILPDALPAQYATAWIGKWHLGHTVTHPNDSGFDLFAGSLYNLGQAPSAGYYLWQKTVDGEQELVTNYATTETADDAIAMVEGLPRPWFVVASFNASHSPWEAPPRELHGYDLPPEPTDDVPLTVRAMTEALDTEIGRLLAHLRDADYVFLLGDNGTASEATDFPSDPKRAKGTVYEGGVHVPLIVTGPDVAVGESAALVNSTDLYSTILEITGRPSTAEDSISFAPSLADPEALGQRDFAFFELFRADGTHSARGVRDRQYKLVRTVDFGSVTEELFDLKLDPHERFNLLPVPPPAAAAAYLRLRQLLP